MPNLRNMRQFYLAFPKRYALRSELNWTHYRILMRVESDDERNLYKYVRIYSGALPIFDEGDIFRLTIP